MASRAETIWTEDPHSNAKRVILRKYLQAYIPVVGSKYNTLNIMDVFAGPGKYFGQEDNEDGVREEGSPMIALHAAMGYFEEQVRRKKSERLFASGTMTHIRLFYGEAREDRLRSLKQRVKAALSQQDSDWEILYEDTDNLLACNGDFNIEIIYVQSKFENFPVKSMPEDERTFAFIDPFGYKAIPFTLIQQLCRKRRMEVFINLMVQPILRGIGKATQLDSINESITTALGTEEWKATTREDKITGDELAQIYAKQLKEKAGMTFTLDFTMCNRFNVKLYHLIFATKHIMGVRCMKEAMNRVTKNDKELLFSSFLVNRKEIQWVNNQDEEHASDMIYNQFKGRQVCVWYSEHEVSIEGYILLETAFVFRIGQLQRLFNKRKIKLNHSFVSNRRTFPENPRDQVPCKVTFMAEGETFERQEFLAMLDAEMGELKIYVGEGRYGYQYDNVQSFFKHSALSVDDGGNEVKADKYLKSLAPHSFICYKKDGGGYKVFEKKGHSHKNQECIMWFDNQMAAVDQEERPAV